MTNVDVRRINSIFAACIWVGLVIYTGVVFDSLFLLALYLFVIQFSHSVNHVLTIKLTSYHSQKVLRISQLVFIPFATVLLQWFKENQGHSFYLRRPII